MNTAQRPIALAIAVLALLSHGWRTPPAILWAGSEGPRAPLTPPVEDGRAGTVVDRQGVALVRPVGAERWTPLRQRSLLMPGDLLRTPVRGANACEVQLANGAVLIVGPGTIVEIVGPDALRISAGEIFLEGAQDRQVQVAGPGKFSRTVSTSWIARVEDGQTATLENPPRWLSGYRDSSTDEWVGSLIAKVDGRDVPLAVGYHKVDAVIRDQIAQTTVEQSFINGTDNRLEGVFYFPLPADASISSFGMWIGGELVEADIVEKQRARQIYEDILRRKKDPGLLEWSGGNLFKARVFPIEAHSEKRIRIRYTQLLPLEGSTVRYRYALRSELLRQRPLRELGIKVSIASENELDGVESTTHEVRIRKTQHAATLEFDAEEFTPERDFEVAFTVQKTAPLTVVSHRRVDDGYFMLLLSPPDGRTGAWQRETLPEGDPIELLVVADTSASMDPSAREQQAEFIRTLLSMLGPKDHFRVMTADIDVQNFTGEPVAAGDESIESAMAFLAGRDSLGWTDLDEVMTQIGVVGGEDTVVVYVGDGIGTTGDADPVALAKRIRSLGAQVDAVVHAVSITSTFEQTVLEALASIGGGSVRRVGVNPAADAFTLLAEAAQPVIKDLRVDFRGVPTARVYPTAPPNLPLGVQQVLLGRYLPTGRDQKGTVVVTGTVDGEDVRFTAPFEIIAGEAGNSFVPRLWARRHLDFLLSQGNSAAIQEDIVAFSQEFGIMTPYTSFLVLENDQDRRTYGVERRVSMRDGEEFFVAGRDQAATEILRQQMREAKTFRLQLRLRMLAEIGDLGRSLHSWSVGYGYPVGGALGMPSTSFSSSRLGQRRLGEESGAELFFSRSAGARDFLDSKNNEDSMMRQDLRLFDMDEQVASEEMFDREVDAVLGAEMAKKVSGLRERRAVNSPMALGARLERVAGLQSGYAGGGYRWQQPLDFSALGFPYLPAPHTEVPVRRADWPESVHEVLARLDRRSAIETTESGLSLRILTTQLHPLQGKITSWSEVAGYFLQGEWTQLTTGRSAQPTLSYVADGNRGVIARSLGFGRRRDADDRDRRFQFPLGDFSTQDLARSYVNYTAELVELDGPRVKVILTGPQVREYRLELLIDTERSVLLQLAYRTGGDLTSTTDFSDFAAVGSVFWARRVEHRNAEGNLVWRRTLGVESLEAEPCAQQIRAALGDEEEILYSGLTDPTVAQAKQAILAGDAGFLHHLRMVTSYAATQRWDEMWESFDEVADLVAGKPAVSLCRLKLQSVSRRGEDFRDLVREIVAPWTRSAVNDIVDLPAGVDFLTQHVHSLAGPILSVDERLGLLTSLEPIFRRTLSGQPTELERVDSQVRDFAWRRGRASLLESLRRTDEALALRRETARVHADEFGAVNDYVRALGNAQLHTQRGILIRTSLDRDGFWLPNEIGQLFNSWTETLYYLRDLTELQRVTTRWIGMEERNWVAYQRYLASLMFRNRGAEVEAWVRERFAQDDPSDEAGWARMYAAVQHAVGQGWNMYSYSVRERYEQPLVELARRCAQLGDQRSLQIANLVAGNYYFRQTDAWRDLALQLREDLLSEAGIADMTLPRLSFYMSWVAWDRNSISRPQWVTARDQLQVRFSTAPDLNTQQAIGRHVLTVLDAWEQKDAAVEFLRGWLDVAKANPETVARNLFDRLLGLDWTREVEDEAFGLVIRLQPAQAIEDQQEQITADAVRRLAAGVQAMRVAEALGPVAELEKLPREERREKTTRVQLEVRNALAARFAEAARVAGEREARWLQIERIAFAAEAGADRATTVARAADLLAEVPAEREGEPVAYTVLRERACVAMAFAATRRDTTALIGDDVLARYRIRLEEQAENLDWRYQIFRLLVALDRTDDLAAHLRDWIEPDKADSTWRRALGYLMAEGGELAEAVEVFEGVESADELFPADYKALAAWYLVLGDDRRRERALQRRWDVSSESALNNVVANASNKANSRGGGLSSALDADDLAAMRTLLRKATYPDNYLWQIRNVYRGSKDFRVLGCLPYGVVGHTAGSVYRFLGNVGQAIQEVHEEATCDSLVAAIAEGTGQTDRAVDRRGLLLLTSQVERRAAEVLNAPGGHVDKALAALQAASKGEWEPGERVLMAGYLASLGQIKHDVLAREQLRQLRSLFAEAESATSARLEIAVYLARTQWNYSDRDAAIDTLGLALNDGRTDGGFLPLGANNAVATYLGYLRQSQRFTAGETFILEETERQSLPTQKDWYTTQLFGLYVDCVSRRGEVSLGKGERLYLAVRDLLLPIMWEGTGQMADAAFASYLDLANNAHRVGVRRVAGDLVEFAESVLPELVTRFVLEQGERYNRAASTLHYVVSPAAGLELLISALEREPEWLRGPNREYWRNMAWTIAQYRLEAHDPDLDARLLPLAITELKYDLLKMNWRNNAMFHRSNKHFWVRAAGDFSRATGEFIREHSDSGSRVMFAARFLWDGLGAKGAAIDALAGLDRRGVLHEEGRWQLAQWLEATRRYSEVVPIVAALIEERQDRLDYRAALIRNHHFAGEHRVAREILLATSERWHDRDWWQESAMATLAETALRCEIWAQAAQWYEEAVRENERAGTSNASWHSVRSGYYSALARAHAGLGDTDAAIDAASAAVVTWGEDQGNRQAAISALHQVITEVEDLAGYARRWGAKVEESGLDAPVIRKQLGKVFLERGASEAAIEQLLLARELQPTDKEVHGLLVKAYDRLGDQTGAITAMRSSIAMSPMDLELYIQLARRLTVVEDEVGAERAYTSMVEVQPNEAESHRRLAEVRANQRRYTEAVVQWHQVVRVRKLEPEGWLSLAEAQIAAREFDGAQETLQHVLDTLWRDGRADARRQALVLQKVLADKRG